MLVLQDNNFSLQAFIQATPKLSGADGKYYLNKVCSFKQTKEAYVAHIMKVARFTKTFIPQLMVVSERHPNNPIKKLGVLPNANYIFNLSVNVRWQLRTPLGNSVHDYRGLTKHYLCTRINPSVVKLDDGELAAIASILADGVFTFEPKVIEYLYTILDTHPSYKQVVLDTLKQIDINLHCDLNHNLNFVKKSQIELDNIQQIYKDLLHDTSNYRNTRYKHTSYLQDYIKSKESK